MAKNDLFYLHKIFPEPDKIFSFVYKEISAVKDNCIFILDTNVLLIPFFTSKDSIDDFSRIFNKLKDSNRILIPSRVAIEFATNRGTKLSGIFARIHEVRDQLNKFNVQFEDFPILENQTDYKKIKEIQKKINQLKVDYRNHLDQLANYVQQWNWNDPVSKLYKKIFTKDIIIDVKKDNDFLEKDLEFRIQHFIPPGYKDSKKIDKGIGDLIIWHTILEIGEDRKTDIIFVTNEKKNDWFYVQHKTGLYPRFELYEEFRRKTKGKSINIISFADFLNILEAKQETVEEVKRNIEKTEKDQITKRLDIGSIKKDDRIIHPSYGYGTVLEIENRQDNSKIGKIIFDECGEKQLLLHVHDIRMVNDDSDEQSCIIE